VPPKHDKKLLWFYKICGYGAAIFLSICCALHFLIASSPSTNLFALNMGVNKIVVALCFAISIALALISTRQKSVKLWVVCLVVFLASLIPTYHSLRTFQVTDTALFESYPNFQPESRISFNGEETCFLIEGDMIVARARSGKEIGRFKPGLFPFQVNLEPLDYYHAPNCPRLVPGSKSLYDTL
jgi:hypothetical protein